MKNTTIAALLTCHNRKQNTLASLTALFNQVCPAEVTLCVYLVDDGSTDGTTAAVRQLYPQVKILPGNGSLFWNGGMQKAFAEAIQHDYDYYLWLNDDTLLYPEALNTLLETSSYLTEQGYASAIITGSTRDAQTGVLTYGGVLQSSWWHPFHFCLVEPTEQVKRCDTMNGNCVLIPRQAAQAVGNLDSAFRHYAGDYDYGLRAQKRGCTVWTAPGYVGTCSQNIPPDGISDLTLHKQWSKTNQPKGLPLKDVILHPFDEWKVFAQRHGGLFWPVYCLMPYRRLLWNSIFSKLRGFGYTLT